MADKDEGIPEQDLLFLISLRQQLSSFPSEEASDEDIRNWAANLRAQLESASRQYSVASWLREAIIEVVNPLLGAINGTIDGVKGDIRGLKGEIDKVTDMITPRKWFDEALNYAEDQIFQTLKPKGEALAAHLEGSVELLAVAHAMEKLVGGIHKRLNWTGDVLCFLLEPDKKGGDIAKSTSRQFTEAIWQLIAIGEEVSKQGGNVDFANLAGELATRIGTLIEVAIKPIKHIVEAVAGSVTGKGPPQFAIMHGIAAGRLDEFLNGDLPGGTEEREFRLEILGAIDQLAHTILNVVSTAGGGGGRQPSSMLIPSLIDSFFRIVIGKVFTIPGLPSLNMPLNSLSRREDREPLPIASRVSRTISNAVSAPLRGYVGLLVRGVWEVNIYNEAIAETIATLPSAIVNSILEAVIYTLLSVVELKETYREPESQDGFVVLTHWATKAQWGDEGEIVHDAVIVNPTIIESLSFDNPQIEKDITDALTGMLTLAVPKAKNDGFVVRILKDYAALLEIDHLYNEPPHPDGRIDAKVEATGEDIKLTAAMARSADTKVPGVMRAFANGRHQILPEPKEGKKGNWAYKGKIEDVAGASHVWFLEGSRHSATVKVNRAS